MKLHNLTYAEGSRKNRKRVGRGQGSGHGETASKGVKGARSRSGDVQRAWFEGGQMPIQRRLPKHGFTNIHRVEYQVVNLNGIERILDRLEGELNPLAMFELGLISKKGEKVKVLGMGKITKKVQVKVHAISESAKTKIEAAGGSVTII